MDVCPLGLVPRLFPRKTGRQPRRSDDVSRDVLCVIFIIKLLPTQSIFSTISAIQSLLLVWMSLRLQIDTGRLFHYYLLDSSSQYILSTTALSSTLPRHCFIQWHNGLSCSAYNRVQIAWGKFLKPHIVHHRACDHIFQAVSPSSGEEPWNEAMSMVILHKQCIQSIKSQLVISC